MAPREKKNKNKGKDELEKTEEEIAAAAAEKPPEVIQELTPDEKAAAVIVSLGMEKAASIYQHMESDDVEKLTVQIAKLGFVDAPTTENVLLEFYQMCLTNKAVTEGGLEYARAVLESAFGKEASESLLDKVTQVLVSREFDFLNKADEKSLFGALQHERPQTIALILSYVETSKAAGVIEQLDKDLQVQVVEGIANMENASPTAVKIIEEEMNKRFSSIMQTDNIEVGGVDYVADIMNNLDRASEKNIFDMLSEKNVDLAEEIRKRMFTFEDIVTMDDRSVQRFVRDCDQKDLVLALKGADRSVANKVFANMSSRMAQSISDDLEITTNVRMREAEEAQQRIVGIIRTLEEQQELVITKGGKDDIIA